jgi:hypothetical protein
MDSDKSYECRKLFHSGDIVSATQILESARENNTCILIEYNQGPGKGDAFVIFAVKHGCKVYNFNCTTYVVMNRLMREQDDTTNDWTTLFGEV